MLLGPADSLPGTTRRILITGASGAGKSTLREAISATLGIPTVEIDSLYHGPGWTVRPTFVAEVEEFSSAASWVVEWQYSQVKPMLLDRADVLIWLDHNRWTVTERVIRRTLRRRLRRIQLWNGNFEPPLRTIFTDPDHIVRWSWRTQRPRRREAMGIARRPDGPIVVRLAGQGQVEAWRKGPLRVLASAQGAR